MSQQDAKMKFTKNIQHPFIVNNSCLDWFSLIIVVRDCRSTLAVVTVKMEVAAFNTVYQGIFSLSVIFP